MVITNTARQSNGNYRITSLPCPSCKTALITEITSDKLFAAHQGAMIQDVLGHLNDDDRERFVSGYCPKCWVELFGEDEGEE